MAQVKVPYKPMDARVSELFDSGNGSHGGASNVKQGNDYAVAHKKACVKNKKISKARLSRNFKPNNNAPYLPPEVRRESRAQLRR